MSTETVSKEKHASFALGGTKLFLTEALRKDGTLVVGDKVGEERADVSSFEKKSKNIIGHQRQVDWEAVRVRTDGEPEGKGYFRLKFAEKDPLTSGSELEERQALAKQLGAVETKPSVVNGHGGLQALIGGRHGKTSTDVDVFFTQKGIDNIRSVNKEKALAAYGATVAESTGKGVPAWADPKTGPEARAMIEEYEKARKDNQQAGGHSNMDNTENWTRYQYKEKFGREIWRDAESFESGMKFGDAVQRMNSSKDPVEWNKGFADLGKGVGFDFFDSLASFNRLAGKDEVLVHRLSVKGSDVDIEMKDEGLIGDPRARTALSESQQ
jgi:hypothetical protein